MIATTSPTGPEWLHEVKFDGWRVQIHRRPDDVVKLFSRNGRDITDRFPTLTDASLYLPECIVDGELVACEIPTGDRTSTPS